ncbi:nucleoside triphosphate pyrophosphohydrolase [Rhodococcus sp. 14-2483-1-1]|uniref:MazG family protein n=1 Tax=unclassified Rhodococcus (in: high G+C Gram-positive bacteria) TaxID=192944 RepID=UPI000B9C05E2|nr:MULTISPECIES: MazG family protein [unclassified Rhodococcus (in: high G+C Gram-positive bacteria)]OZC52510.1 nucleoside triphosphate pyrophosphohydrolase [Rhodococcus sp. WWJCD1]OZF41028.1 nucleoside triphosphate pyrophosphohydrolase [Rhodococcus sp. 14-2483-1-1]
MTVVLLDPVRPAQVPVDAVEFLGGAVQFTEEVPVRVRWLFSGTAAPDAVDPVLVSTDRANPDVQDRIARGERVIAAEKLPGDDVIAAVHLMDRLHTVGGWEAQQTHESLRGYLLEETYELLDAIAAGNLNDLREELGDLLLQVLFHSRIAQNAAENAFDIDDVAAGLVAKLTHRSPHLARQDGGPIDIVEQERAWEAQKASEKARRSCIDGIALSQPSLALAQKVIGRATKAGLPDELVPDGLRVVHIGVDHSHGGESAEDALRRRVLDFASLIRNAEASARNAGIAPGEMSALDWIEHWGLRG